MSNTIYKNRLIYIKKMKSFVNKNIDGETFCDWFLSQRLKDLNEDEIFFPERKKLYQNIFKLDLETFEKLDALTREYPKDNIFLDLFDVIQSNDIEDFCPREKEYFMERENIDEEELRKKIILKLKILEENKDLWEFDTAEEDMNRQNQIQKKIKMNQQLVKSLEK